MPLDPNYPHERLAFMLADAGCPVLVTQQTLLDRLPDNAARRHVVRLDADASAIARQPETAPPLDLDPRHPAYVIYTSGSTGTPKGVMVEPCGALSSHAVGCIVSNRCNGVASLVRSAISFDASVSGDLVTTFGRRQSLYCSRNVARDLSQLSASRNTT